MATEPGPSGPDKGMAQGQKYFTVGLRFAGGVMAFTLAEAVWLVRSGVSNDVLVAYPSVDRTALARREGGTEAG